MCTRLDLSSREEIEHFRLLLIPAPPSPPSPLVDHHLITIHFVGCMQLGILQSSTQLHSKCHRKCSIRQQRWWIHSTSSSSSSNRAGHSSTSGPFFGRELEQRKLYELCSGIPTSISLILVSSSTPASCNSPAAAGGSLLLLLLHVAAGASQQWQDSAAAALCSTCRPAPRHISSSNIASNVARQLCPSLQLLPHQCACGVRIDP